MSTMNGHRAKAIVVEVASPSAPSPNRRDLPAATHRITIALSRSAFFRALGNGLHAALFESTPRIAAAGPDVHLVFEVVAEAGDGSCARVQAYLADPVHHQRFALVGGGGAVAIVEDGAWLHIEAPNLLSATLRAGDASAKPLYVKTPLLAAMGLGGGRYEVM